MDFGSIDEAIAYVENSINSVMPNLGNHLDDLMKYAINHDIYSAHPNTTDTRTGQLGNCVEIRNDGMTLEGEYMDNGSWYSLVGKSEGEHFFPLEGYKVGKVWAKNGGYYSATPLDTAFDKAQAELPKELVDYLRGMGIPRV